MGIFDKQQFGEMPSADGFFRGIASESHIPNAIAELLKSGSKTEDLMMRGRLADQGILNSWLDYWVRCVRYSEFATGVIKEAWEKKN